LTNPVLCVIILYMSTIIVLNQNVLFASIGVAVACCVAMAVIMVLTDGERKPVLATFHNNITAFVIPLFVMFVYVSIIMFMR
jgi:hypothetical protein